MLPVPCTDSLNSLAEALDCCIHSPAGWGSKGWEERIVLAGSSPDATSERCSPPPPPSPPAKRTATWACTGDRGCRVNQSVNQQINQSIYQPANQASTQSMPPSPPATRTATWACTGTEVAESISPPGGWGLGGWGGDGMGVGVGVVARDCSTAKPIV